MGPYRKNVKVEVGDIDWPPSGRRSVNLHKPKFEPELIIFPLFFISALGYLLYMMAWPARVLFGFMIFALLFGEVFNKNNSRSIKK